MRPSRDVDTGWRLGLNPNVGATVATLAETARARGKVLGRGKGEEDRAAQALVLGGLLDVDLRGAELGRVEDEERAFGEGRGTEHLFDGARGAEGGGLVDPELGQRALDRVERAIQHREGPRQLGPGARPIGRYRGGVGSCGETVLREAALASHGVWTSGRSPGRPGVLACLYAVGRTKVGLVSARTCHNVMSAPPIQRISL